MKFFIFLLLIIPVFLLPAAGDTETEPVPPAGAAAEFSTDFSKSLISFDSIFSGGPPRDGIPSIDNPDFITAAEADGLLSENEPDVAVKHYWFSYNAFFGS